MEPRMSNELAVNGTQAIDLNENIIKRYICPQATEQEIYMFLQLCKAQHLNPFLREAYLIKYGTQPASIVTGKDVFIKRARTITAYRGFRGGVVITNSKGEIQYREGGLLLKGENLVGGWAEVFRSDSDAPIRSEVAFDEYAGKKGDGTLNRQWSEKPATMIRKVAVVQAHREAFPDQFEGMYAPEELNVDVEPLQYSPDKQAPGYKEEPKSKSGNGDKAKGTDDPEDDKLSVKDKLAKELSDYCRMTDGEVDANMFASVLKEISIFGKQGDEKWISDIDKASEKWCGTSLGKLRERTQKAE
jgi:phage recombination protein Bet